MKKIIVIPVIVVVLIGIILLNYSRQTGYIKIDVPGFEADLSLRGPGGAKTISASDITPQEIRAGTYKPERAVVRLTKTSDQWWSIFCRSEPWGKLATVNVVKGQTTILKFGPPLEILTDVQRKGQAVSIGLSWVGRAGEHYKPHILMPNGRPSAPKIRIVDETGNVLASGKFEYGWGGVCRYSWRVPEDFKGKYTVKVNMNSGPFEVKQEETWHMI